MVAHSAVKIVVSAPTHRHSVKAAGLVFNMGWNRISRNTPATTIVLE